eukprot:Em0002g510a
MGSNVNRHVDRIRLHEMEGENNASLATQERENSDEKADDDLLTLPVVPEQDQNAPAVAADQQEVPPPPVMEEAPPPAALTNGPAPSRSARPHCPPERFGWI